MPRFKNHPEHKYVKDISYHQQVEKQLHSRWKCSGLSAFVNVAGVASNVICFVHLLTAVHIVVCKVLSWYPNQQKLHTWWDQKIQLNDVDLVWYGMYRNKLNCGSTPISQAISHYGGTYGGTYLHSHCSKQCSWFLDPVLKLTLTAVVGCTQPSVSMYGVQVGFCALMPAVQTRTPRGLIISTCNKTQMVQQGIWIASGHTASLNPPESNTHPLQIQTIQP